MSAPMNIQHRRTPSTTFYAPQPTHARSLSNQLGTSWSDGFEFTSCSPLTSALHFGTSPPTNNAYMYASTAPFPMSCSPRGDYFTFERDYCSNFACCGITLPDMHALVAHFEETHLGGTDGVPFMAHQQSLGFYNAPVPQPKPVPQVNTAMHGNAGMGLVPGSVVGDAPSPNSSVGPETPPPSSHVGGYGFSGARVPQLQVHTQVYGSRGNSTSPYPHSPFSAGSSSSSGASDGCGSQSSLSNSSDMGMDMDVDVLMAFDPLDNAAHTPLDSTPPSPLAHPIRPSSVLRAAALKNSGGQLDAPPVGLPPALFSAPAPSLTLSDKERKDRKERSKEKRSRPESPAVVIGEANNGAVVRVDKNRKAVSNAKGSLLGLGPTSSRSSISSSSDEASSSGHSSGAEKEHEKKSVERPEKIQRTERAERTGRPERPDKNGKRSREKAYKCPKPGCTKSYLNPNGLKYHTLKGTCTFATGSAPPTPVTPTTPSLPCITVPSAPPVVSLSVSTKPMSDGSSNIPIITHPLTPTSLPSTPTALFDVRI